MPVDKFGRMSDTKTKDTGVSLTYINNNYVRSDGETPLTGSLDMRGNTIYNVADPVNPQDVATKEYVDSGGKHLIAVSTYYCGSLIKGEYQFPFGGNACEEAGFLMPQSGQIKKVKLEIFGRFKKIGNYEDLSDISHILEKEFLGEIENVEELKKIPDTMKEFNIWRNKLFKVLFLGGDLFSIISFKNNSDEIINKPTSSILSTYRCVVADPIDYDPDIEFIRNCVFDYDLKNHPLSEGEVINIRTEIDRNVKSVFSFMFTFLIELDPL